MNKQNKITDFFKTVKERECEQMAREESETREHKKMLDRELEKEMRREDREEREHGKSWWRM